MQKANASKSRGQPEATANTKHLFFLDVGQALQPPEISIEFHMVSYCSTIKVEYILSIYDKDSGSKSTYLVHVIQIPVQHLPSTCYTDL